MKTINADKSIVFFDIDDTLAACDVFDDIILHFSKDERWIEIEKRWKEGKIGSKECLEGQLKGVRISRKAFDGYLATIKLDPYFKRLLKFLKTKKIKAMILSDNFDYILRRVLNNKGARRLKIYSNRLRFVKDRLIPGFPFTDKKCRICGHCKKKNLLANIKRDSIIIYIGDGRSDICPAKCAHLVFAKKGLLRHFRDKKLACVPFRSLKDVHGYLRRSVV